MRIRNKLLILLFGILFVFMVSSAYATSFQNGDFSSGFTGWSGEIIDTNFSTTTVDPDTSSLFSIVSPNNQAQISLDDTYWNNTLYQDFDMDSIESGWKMQISFWIKGTPSDGLSATLSDQNGQYFVNLLSEISNSALLSGTNVTVDITSFAQNHGGEQVELAFTLYDLDYDTSDLLNVDNITFTKIPATPVPVPSSMLLLFTGLVSLGIGKKMQE